MCNSSTDIQCRKLITLETLQQKRLSCDEPIVPRHFMASQTAISLAVRILTQSFLTGLSGIKSSMRFFFISINCAANLAQLSQIVELIAATTTEAA